MGCCGSHDIENNKLKYCTNCVNTTIKTIEIKGYAFYDICQNCGRIELYSLNYEI